MNTQLPELEMSYTKFLDKTTVLYGESRTGKSTVIVDVLFQLQPYVDQIIVFSPMDRQNHTYDGGIVPPPCIHYSISAQLLDDIWERQSALANVYTRANDPDTLEKLFKRIPPQKSAKALDQLEQIRRRMHSYEAELSESESAEVVRNKVEEMRLQCEKLRILVYKTYINQFKTYLNELRPTKKEKFCIQYLNLNPRMVIIFDDCTDMMKKFKTHRVMQKLFYQGRWAFITALIACHTDKALDPELKKNTFVTVFTEETCALGYFNRASNDLDKDAKRRAKDACKFAFTPMAKYQKLVWIRDEKKFFTLTAKKHDNFRFGCDALWDYCNIIKADSGGSLSDNKFIRDFDE
jgi:hypothetical protein